MCFNKKKIVEFFQTFDIRNVFLFIVFIDTKKEKKE